MALFGRRGKSPQEMDETERRRRALDAERSALLFIKGGLLRPAEADLRRCVALAPEYAAGHNYLGLVLYRLGDLEEAHRALTTAVSLAPDDEALRRTHGTILESLGRLEEAEAEYSVAAALDSESGYAHAALGGILLKRGRAGEAEAHLLTATKLNPSDTQALADLATLREGRHSLIGAIDALRRALAVFSDAEAPLVVRTGGMVAVQDSGARAAVAAPFHYHLGRLLEQQGDMDGAIAELRIALEHLSSDPKVVQALGRVLIKRGRDAEVQQVYEKAIKANPVNRAVYEADQYALLVEFASPATHFSEEAERGADDLQGTPSGRTSASSTPDAKPALTGRLSSGPLPEAILRLQEAIAADPENSRLRRDLSIEYTRIGMVTEAKEQFRYAEQLRSAQLRAQRSVG